MNAPHNSLRRAATGLVAIIYLLYEAAGEYMKEFVKAPHCFI